MKSKSSEGKGIKKETREELITRSLNEFESYLDVLKVKDERKRILLLTLKLRLSEAYSLGVIDTLEFTQK